jgi:hypothetical protein
VPTGVLTEYQSEVQIFPSVDFSDIFNTNLDLDQITIQIISSYVEDKSLYVATVVSQNGNPIENPNFVTRWYLEDINFNRVFLEEKTENCLYGCSIALSPDLQTGDYHIIVELVNIETERPIANGSTTLSINTNSQNSPLELVDSQAICEYEEWETEYSCKDGYACYNLFYSSNDTSCQPETRIVEGKHFRCAAEARCDNPEGIANSPTTPDQSCQPNNWKDETPYSCENGWACYNRWKIAGGNSCNPEPDYGEDGNWYICKEDSECGTPQAQNAQ